MTTTDRAFIAALQQSAAWPPAESSTATTPTPIPTPESAATGGPHFEGDLAVEKRKAPLSEHLARRREASSASATAQPATLPMPLRPGVEVQAFPWPALAERLAADARLQLLDLLSAATDAGDPTATPAIAFVGVRRGVGASTALLATALLVESVGGKVGILDISSDEGSASPLGVRRSYHLSGRIDATLIDELLVSSRAGETSALALGPEPDAGLVHAAIDRLSSTHDLLLIDIGATRGAAHLARLDAAPPLTVLLDHAGGSDDDRLGCLGELARAGVTPIGLVETLADRC